MWETIPLVLSGLALVLLFWLILLLIRLKKIRSRLHSRAAQEIEKAQGSRSLKIEELRERVNRLESGYRFFFEEAQTYNILLDREGRIKDMNRAFLNLFDREKAELEGGLLLDLVDETDQSEFTQYFQKHRKDNYTPEQEVVFSGPGGKRRLLFGEKHLTVVEGGIPAGILLSGIDITARRRVEAGEEELKRKLALSARMESLGIMAGGIAHDLKNLFNPVLSYPDYIADKLPLQSDLREPLRRIKNAAAQASELVQNFLALARRGRLELRPLDLNSLVRTYIKSMGCKSLDDRFPAARITLDLASQLPMVEGLAPQLNSVLMNLVKNSCEAMKEGGKICVSTRAETLDQPYRGLQQVPRGDYAILKVEDTGKGMEKEEIKRLFTPFTSGKEMGGSGTGLGMVVVAGVIEDHHGYIDVRSEPGRGTAVMIYLRAIGEEGDRDVRTSRLGARILVVDDDETDRGELARRLSSCGYRVAQVSDGEEAMSYLQRHSPDLLVMDLMLDQENGLDLYRRIREVLPRIRCVLISGKLDQRAREEAAALGINVVFTKPPAMEELSRLIGAELNKSHPADQIRD